MTKALVLVGLGIGVISTVDNVVRPLLLSGRAHMNGLVIFVSLLGGLRVFGLWIRARPDRRGHGDFAGEQLRQLVTAVEAAAERSVAVVRTE